MGQTDHTEHNVRQIKAAINRGEASLKGTAPSFFNNESDRGKPGPVSPISEKGYRHLEAVAKSTDNADTKPEELAAYGLSSRRIRHALAYVRRERFDLYRAVLRVENDPGIVKRWQDGKEPNSPDWLRSWEMASREAARFVEGMWPGTRLFVPTQREERPAENPVQGAAMDRWDNQQEQRANTLRLRYRQFRDMEEANPDASRAAVKAMWSAKHDRSVRSLEDAIRFEEKGEWPDGELAQVRRERRERGIGA